MGEGKANFQPGAAAASAGCGWREELALSLEKAKERDMGAYQEEFISCLLKSLD